MKQVQFILWAALSTMGTSSGRFTPSTSSLSGPRTDCEYNWSRHGSKCYLYLGPDAAFTFDEAVYECRKHYKATLATVKSDHEQQYLESLFKGRNIYNNIWLGAKAGINLTANYVNDNNDPRLNRVFGFNDYHRNRTSSTSQSSGSPFVWITDGAKVDFSKRLNPSSPLRTRNPNSTMCLSMVLVPEYFGIWSPYDCNYYFNVLCEKSMSSLSTATGPTLKLVLLLITSLTIVLSRVY